MQSSRDWSASRSRKFPKQKTSLDHESPSHLPPESAEIEPWLHKPETQFPAKSKTCAHRPKSPASWVGNTVESRDNLKARARVGKDLFSVIMDQVEITEPGLESCGRYS